MLSKWIGIVLIVCLVTGMFAAVRAADTCTVTGEVADKATGQKLADVNVILTNMRTGVQRGTRTDAAGKYVFTTVFPPGQYKLTFSLQNYVPVELTDIWLAINDTKVVIPPLALERVAGPAATVTVEGKEAVVNTTDAAQRLTLDELTVVALPLSGVRTFDELAFLAPGVAPVAQSAGTGPGVGPGVGTAGQFSINGERGRANNFLVDMSDNNDQDVGVRRQGYVSLVPQSIESIQQFQIIAGAYQAEFGRNSGAIVNAISKTGGNAVHGSIYGFLTGSRLSARDPFDQLDGPAAGESPYRRAQFGAAVGGPFARNRSFWFGSVERQRIMDRPERHFAVPLAAERSYFGISPLRSSTIPGVSELEKYFADAGYYLSGIAGAAVWSLVPQPNNSGGPYGANTYTEAMNGDGAGTIFSIKADHKLSAGHAFTARYNFTDDQVTIPAVGGGIRSSIRPETRTQNVSLFLNSVLSDRATNQLRLSYGRTNLNFLEAAGSPLLFGSTNTTQLAALLAPVPYLQDPLKTPIRTDFGSGSYGPFGSTGALGQLVIHPYSPIGVDVYNFPQARINNTYQYADTFVYSRGAHILKFGVDIRRTGQNSRLDRNVRALAEFNSGYGFDVDGSQKILRGRDLASIGYATSVFQTMIPDLNDDGRPDFDTRIALRFTEYNFFLQEDWKLVPRLTLSLGVRYEYNTTPESVNRVLESTFSDPLAGVPSQVYGQGDEANRASFETMVSSYRAFVQGRELMYKADKKNWAPRVGIAWDVTGDGKTALRAGYGVFHNQIISAVTSQSRNVFPHLIPLNSSGFGTELFGVYLLSRQWLFLNVPGAGIFPHQRVGTVDAIGVPARYFGVYLGSQARQGKQGLAFTLPTPELQTPSVQHYQVTFERELFADTLFSAAYVGSKGAHLSRFRYPNGGIAGRPQFGISAQTAGTLKILTVQTQPPATRVRGGLGPYTVFENSAPSRYDSLQLACLRRFSKALEFTAAYTWSHAIDEVSDVFSNIGFFALPQSDASLRTERASANFDVRHRFAGSFLWELPVAHGSAVLGGWRLAGIFTGQTGQPFTVNTSIDVNNDGVLTDRLDKTAGLTAGTGGPVILVAPASPADLLAAPGQNGKVGRNTFRAPGVAAFDMAVIKMFRFAERANVEVRAEMFNLFNRTHFGIPVRILEAPAFGRAVETSLNARRVQFALKLNF